METWTSGGGSAPPASAPSGIPWFHAGICFQEEKNSDGICDLRGRGEGVCLISKQKAPSPAGSSWGTGTFQRSHSTSPGVLLGIPAVEIGVERELIARDEFPAVLGWGTAPGADGTTLCISSCSWREFGVGAPQIWECHPSSDWCSPESGNSGFLKEAQLIINLLP